MLCSGIRTCHSRSCRPVWAGQTSSTSTSRISGASGGPARPERTPLATGSARTCSTEIRALHASLGVDGQVLDLRDSTTGWTFPLWGYSPSSHWAERVYRRLLCGRKERTALRRACPVARLVHFDADVAIGSTSPCCRSRRAGGPRCPHQLTGEVRVAGVRRTVTADVCRCCVPSAA